MLRGNCVPHSPLSSIPFTLSPRAITNLPPPPPPPPQDATGHARRLVKFASDFTPGYQAAYGILVEVESHPYPVDEMLFMDWRDEHLDAAAKERNRSLPSFLYVMPFGPTRIFAEETSLVARPGLDFDDVKLRMKQRFEKQGIKVVKVLEEEHCFIPMGARGSYLGNYPDYYPGTYPGY